MQLREIMEIGKVFGNSNSPAFKSFSIESSEDKTPQKYNKKHLFRGTEKFLFLESANIAKTKKEIGNYTFPNPLEKIMKTIANQKNNPYDIVMFAKEHSDPIDDEIFVAVKNLNGETYEKRPVYNSVNIVKDSEGKPNIISHLYSILDWAEETANNLKQNNK